MAVIITKQDGKLTDSNSFYRVEAYNLGGYSTNDYPYRYALTTTTFIPLTFANAGNFKGVVLNPFTISSVTNDRNIWLQLTKSDTVTLTIASPGVVNLNSHGFTEGQLISFTTTGALPTGITANTQYYVRNPLTNSFNISATPTGTIINFTGTQSGTQTSWATIAQQTKAWREIHNIQAGTVSRDLGNYIYNFNAFDLSPAVTTASGKYILRCLQTGGTNGTLYLNPSYYSAGDFSYIFHAAYCDNVVSYNDGDTPIFAHYTDIDKSTNFTSVLGKSDTVYGIAGIICSNTDATIDNVCFLRCLTPAAPYTLTLKGILVCTGHAGLRLGTEDTPIPLANAFTIMSDTPTVGTTRGSIKSFTGTSSTNYYYGKRQSLFAYGATDLVSNIGTLANNTTEYGRVVTISIANPAVVTLTAHGKVANDPVKFTTNGSLPTGGTTSIIAGTTYYVVAVNANSFRLSLTPGGAAISTLGGTQSGTHYLGDFGTIVTTEDMSTKGWKNGDYVTVCKGSIYGRSPYISSNVLAITNISGTTITLSHAIPIEIKYAGGDVINHGTGHHSIVFDNNSTSAGAFHWFQSPDNFTVKNCYLNNSSFYGFSNLEALDDADANKSAYLIDSCVGRFTYDGTNYIAYGIRVPKEGYTIQNTVCHRGFVAYGGVGNPVLTFATYKSGTYTVTNTVNCGGQSGLAGGLGKCVHIMTNERFYGFGASGSSLYPLNMINSTVTGLKVWGFESTGSSLAAVAVGSTCVGNLIENVTINNCLYTGLLMTLVSVNNTFKNIVINDERRVGYDWYAVDGTYANNTFLNCNFYTKGHIDLTGLLDGTKLSFVELNDVTNNDITELSAGTIYRTGDGLTDTTVHTSGTGKYAMKFINSQGSTLKLEGKIPTGDIQGKTLVMSVRCKIKSSNYWSTTNTLPRLVLKYDNNVSEAYAEAAETTDRQLLFVPVTPTTTFGEITTSIETASDAGDRGAVTVDSTTDLVTLANHGFTGGEMIKFSTDGTIPGGMIADTRVYYVKYNDANTFYVADTYDGANIDITDNGTGTLTLFTYFDVAVVFDDVSIFYPPGVQLNLGGLDLWSNALPISPYISTNIQAADVRAYPKSLATVSNSMGETVIGIEDNCDLIPTL